MTVEKPLFSMICHQFFGVFLFLDDFINIFCGVWSIMPRCVFGQKEWRV